MKKFAMFFGMTAALASSAAMAGAKWGFPVVVYSTYFVGSMGATRASGASTDYIEISDKGATVYVRALQASNGLSASCVTSDPTMISQLRSANSDSVVFVSYSSGTCTSVTITNSSAQAPKVM